MAETADARWANRSAVLAALFAGGEHSRPELSRSTDLSAATVSRVVDGLLEEGLVREGSTLHTGRRGRQAVLLDVAAERGVACGVDLGGTTCRFLVTDLLGGAPTYRVEPTPQGYDADALAGWLAARVDELCADRMNGETARATVIGLPGAVASDGSTVRGATNLPEIEGTAFTASLRGRLGDRIDFDNDANLALEGELRHGAASTAHTAAMFTIGRGFGAGVALDRRVVGGATGMVGEFGFLPVGVDGRTVEGMTSADGLVDAARRRGVAVDGAADVFGDDPRLQPVLADFERALSAAVIAVTLAYEPDLVVLGGRIAESIGPRMLGRVRDSVLSFAPHCPDLRPPDLGDRAGAIGAVSRALTLLRSGFGVEPAAAAGVEGSLDVTTLLAPHGEEPPPCS